MTGQTRRLEAAYVVQALQSRASEVAETLTQLLQQPSVSGAEEPASNWLYTFLTRRGWTVERQPLVGTALARSGALSGEQRIGDRENLVAWTSRSGKPIVVINGHIDVVTPGEPASWSRLPFGGEREGDRLYGRGAVDTKGGIVAAIFALELLRDSGDELPFDVVLELVVGEETTGCGTRAVAELVPDPIAAIVLEATGGAIVPVSTGLLFFTIDVRGVAAHTSAPWRGRDAFVHLMSIYRTLVSLASERGAAYRSALFGTIPTAIPFAVGTASAGTWRAAIPDTATMSGRVGVAPGEDLDFLKNQIEEIIAGLDELESWPFPTTVDWQHDLPGWETDTDTPLVQGFVASAAEVLGDAQLIGLTAASDAAYFGAMHIPVIIFGPGDLSLAHSPDEWVSIDAVTSAAAVIAHALSRLAHDGH